MAATEIASAYVALYTRMPGVKGDITKALGGADVQGALKSSGGRMGNILAGAVGGAVALAAGAAIKAVTSAIDGAIRRVDTINNFPKVMQNLGYSADDAEASIAAMSDRLTGLPTALDSMAGMVQQLAPLTGSLASATDLSLAFNNALLAGGKSADIQANAMEQYTQMLSIGKVDMAAWRSIVTAMPGQVNQLAESLLGAGSGAMDLYAAMQDGTIGFDEFNNAVLTLNEDGVAGFASFEEQARSATDGIATGQANMQTAITRGLANLLGKFQPQIMAMLAGLTAGINAAFIGVSGAIDWLSENMDLVIPIISGVAAALLFILAPAIWAAVTAAWAFTVALLANPMTWIVLAIIALVAAIVWLAMNWDEVVAWISDVWGGFVGWLTEVIEGIASWWNDIWTGISDFFTGIWDGIVGFITDYINRVRLIIAIAVAIISKTWNDIWTNVSNFFTGIWEGIVGAIETVRDTFRTVFDAIRGFIVGAFEGAVRTVKNVINGIIDVVNGAIGGINGLIGTVGSAFGLEVAIPRIPRLADGALIRARPGGVLANIGEGRYDEVVQPLGGPQFDGLADALAAKLGRSGDSDLLRELLAEIKAQPEKFARKLEGYSRTDRRGWAI